MAQKLRRFDPIFASQDSQAVDLAIETSAPDQVRARFVYPSNGQKMEIDYSVAKTVQGWRIADILYPDSATVSLKALLSR